MSETVPGYEYTGPGMNAHTRVSWLSLVAHALVIFDSQETLINASNYEYTTKYEIFYMRGLEPEKIVWCQKKLEKKNLWHFLKK